MAGSGRRSARSRIKLNTDADEDRTTLRNPKLRKHRSRDHSLIRLLNVDLKVLLGFAIIAFLIVLFMIHRLIIAVEYPQKPRVVTPFPAPKIMDLPQFQGDHKESLYWGTYRPNVYLGIRARTPQSLVAGLMWLGLKDGRYFMRHVCQDSDELKTYGWTLHNGRDYGRQMLVDQDMTLITSFLKSKEDGSGYGGDWAVRIDVQSENEEMQTVHLFFYLADEDGNALSLSRETLNIRENSLLAFGSRTDVGSWNLNLESMDDLEVHYSGFRTPHIHNLSDLVQQNLGAQVRKFGRLQLSDTSDDSSNILVFQISGRIYFRTDVAFVSRTGLKDSRLKERLSSLTGTLLTSQLDEKEKEFDDKFKKCFNLADELDSESISTGKAAVASLLGGIGYFYGQSKISVPSNSNFKSGENYILYWPAELYTAVPSRPFFPRGFLWDEGFHQLLIWRWDIHISLDIIGHWLDLMNVDGWIPREQILGDEARSKVPEEFIIQHPTNGNPPTLFLVLRDLVCGMKRNKFTATERDQISSVLDRAFVRLEAWFQWFNTTQLGKDMSSYFWHGRDNATMRELNPKTLTSGLDDYPRASHPTEDERHLDLRCWMFLAADCLHSISKLLQKEHELGKEYDSTAKLLSNFEILNQMHFDDAHGTYLDFGNHTEKVRLSWREVMGNNHYASRELVREVLEQPRLRFVPHIGYVSLFPFVAGIIPPDSTILEQQLNLISNRSILWTDYGLRSLSKTSSMYMKYNTEHDAPYWRGPIWMNINYMILSSLHRYSKENGPYRDKAKIIYNDLRSNLIRNVVKNYQQTGYFWEQFDQKKGKGKGARVFTGWTSLVLLIMAEAYSEW
ncbi:mannosyl-oligosaccharide glucosidase GCS1 isoform X6 [Camellia sinensis]|uniref:mannosyl-oligosaccharide glucosidase GCS1 isoform X6 n=1 Tax=Camellia sinensis TaxID=4442 RepID=UPI0010366B09|nr:mannosyl-oligosaccharide glucosidase GCS1 isoform X6 [Camellia sinensis]